ncbi:6,7-dimethyl-8-ribityllumazine synthase [candidate division WOR-3 bacterium]|uniref:6,7-dimethyl-8-ribityllumazine synthase n=1 Tax=candidate division WOR-3 bacterium TaxID=2052148 RepID=A0A7C5HFP6_UNCW3|nr:6,7-dimethyl-8-ribityllumazine synthase [candidate division WOR-3 bacterium]HHE04731.1 6,7-dimethyl-8-ribityllumazine synthase [candidate division WOR-3 bacterium]
MEFQGEIKGKGVKVGIVVSRFNSFVTKRLLEGAMDCLERHGVEKIDVFWVPGSFEVPLALKKIAELKKYNGLIALSAVIRGDTPHFDYVAKEITRGISEIGINFGIPISFGVITADSEDQAFSRAGLKSGNRGWDAAMTVLEMVNLIESVT